MTESEIRELVGRLMKDPSLLSSLASSAKPAEEPKA